ncbi:MAG: DUF4865 family protein [Sneathiella sp.]|nr:DUF4865 family protein [Sneathiella sp.]
MLAMQYSVRLPKEYDADRVSERVSRRGPMFAGYPGLAHKFYLYDQAENIYAPLYIWENGQAAQNFLMNSLFGDVVQDFGRPRVRSWQILDFGYGPSHAAPEYMLAEVDKVSDRQSLKDLKKTETDKHLNTLDADGLFAHMTLLDPDRWEITRCSFWSEKKKSLKSPADCIFEFDVLQENRSLKGVA